jgi:hypothetical protein
VPEGANWDGTDDPALKAQRDAEAAAARAAGADAAGTSDAVTDAAVAGQRQAPRS